jgi:hypothetical protein
MRYANDIALTVIGRQMTNALGDINCCLRDGYLKEADDWATVLEYEVKRFRERLAQIKNGLADEPGHG